MDRGLRVEMVRSSRDSVAVWTTVPCNISSKELAQEIVVLARASTSLVPSALCVAVDFNSESSSLYTITFTDGDTNWNAIVEKGERLKREDWSLYQLIELFECNFPSHAEVATTV